MKTRSLTTKLIACTVAALVAAVLLMPVEVSAVVKSFQIIQSGQPVANTKVTLTSPSGIAHSVETDADGRVTDFNFNEDGDWRAVWLPTAGSLGGEMTISAAGGVPQWVAPTAVGIAGIALVVASSGSDSVSPPPSGSSPPPSPPPPSPPPSAPISGQYQMATFNITSNPDNHFQFFTLCAYDVVESGGSLTIDCDSSSTISFNASGSVDGSNNFTATGIGIYDNNSSTEFQLNGSFDPGAGTWQGTASAGTNGSLPDNNMDMVNDPITGDFTGPMN